MNMASTYILPIRFGVLVSNPLGVSDATREFYSKLGAAIGVPDANIQVCTAVLFSDEYKTGRESSFEVFTDALVNIPSCISLVIDIGGPRYRSCTDYNIVLGLLDALGASHEKFDSVVILSNEVKYLGDPEYAAIQEAAISGKFKIGFLKGPFVGDWKAVMGVTNSEAQIQLSNLYSEAEQTVLFRVEEALERHPGRFRLTDKGNFIAFYYDFRGCVNLAAEAIKFELVGKRDEIANGSIGLYFDEAHNEWFGEAVALATRALGIFERAERLDGNMEQVVKSKSSMVFVPLIRSGQSLKTLLKGFSVPPEVWAFAKVSQILENEGSSTFMYSTNDGQQKSVQLRWLKGLLGVNPAIEKIWNSMDIPPEDHTNILLDEPFSSAAMWALILESGLDVESYGPAGRPLGDPIPNFRAMTEANINLFAAKFLKKAQNSVEPGAFERIIYFCLDEPCARLISSRISGPDNSKSLFISRKTLQDLTNFIETVDVVHWQTGDFENSELPLDSKMELKRLVTSISELQSVALKSPSEAVYCIGLDEFYRSGTTINSLSLAAEFLGLQMRSHVSLAFLSDQQLEFEVPVQQFYNLPTG